MRAGIKVAPDSFPSGFGISIDQNESSAMSSTEEQRERENVETSGHSLLSQHRAAAGGDHEELQRLLAQPGADVNAKDGCGDTLLHQAAQHGHKEGVQLLLAQPGVDANAQAWRGRGRHRNCLTPSDLAVSYGRIELVQLLFGQGATVHAESMIKLLKSDNPEEWGLVEALAQRVELTEEHKPAVEKEHGEDNVRWETLPEDAPLGDNRVLNLRSLKGKPMVKAWQHFVHPRDGRCVVNPFRRAGMMDNGKRLEKRLEWKFQGLQAQKLEIWPAKKVSASVYVCIVDVESCSDPRVLEALSETTNMELLSTPFVEAIVRYTWDAYRKFAFIDIAFNVIFLGVSLHASSLIQAGEWDALKNAWISIALGCGILKRCIEEASQMLSCYNDGFAQGTRGLVRCLCTACALATGLCKYLTGSLVDCIIFAVSLKGWLVLLTDDFSIEDRFWLALWFASLWLRVVFSLRVVEFVGTRFLPIFRAVQGTCSFFLVVGFFFSACVHAYYMLGVRDEPSPFYAAFLQVFRLGFLGDFDLFEFEGVDPTFVKVGDADIWEPVDPLPSSAYASTHTVFLITSMGITLLLMNLLIGVLGAAYDVEEDRASQIYLQHLAMYAHSAKFLPWVKLCRPRKPMPEPSFLYFLAREGGTVETTMSTRAFLKSQLDARDEKLNAKFDALRTELDAKNARLDAKLAALDDKLTELKSLLAPSRETGAAA